MEPVNQMMLKVHKEPINNLSLSDNSVMEQKIQSAKLVANSNVKNDQLISNNHINAHPSHTNINPIHTNILPVKSKYVAPNAKNPFPVLNSGQPVIESSSSYFEQVEMLRLQRLQKQNAGAKKYYGNIKPYTQLYRLKSNEEKIIALLFICDPELENVNRGLLKKKVNDFLESLREFKS